MDATVVLQALQTLQSPNGDIRAAEAQLQSLATQPGFGAVLAQLATAQQQVDAPLRHAAAVLLKQYVKQHWVAGERGFEPPEASEQDKATMRSTLPSGLQDADSKVRTAVGVAVASIAAWDLPAAWPGLLESMVASIKARSNPHLVSGCLRCLSIMAVDLDAEQAPQLLQALSPELSALVADPGTPPGLAATCISIMADLVAALGSLSGAYQRQARDVLIPILQAWVPLMCAVLTPRGAAGSSSSRAAWGPQVAALRLSHQLVLFFSKPLAPAMPALLSATCQLMLALQPLHQSLLVEGNPDAAEDEQAAAAAAGDGEEPVQLELLLANLFELLLSIVGVPSFRAQVRAGLSDMAYLAIAFMQMSQDQAESWAHSATQFVADEDEDIASSRGSCELLLVDLADEFSPAATAAIMQAAARRWGEADALRAAGKAHWWQLREAAHMALSACTEQMLAAAESGEIPAQHVHELLEQLLQRDLSPVLQHQLGDDGQQFIAARALLVASRLREAGTTQQQERLLQAAAAAVTSPAVIAPLRLLAYRALASLAEWASRHQLGQLLPQLLPALVQQLAAADDESVHLVLELLEIVIRAAAAPGGSGLSPEHAMAVAQPVLQVWLHHTADPLIAPDAQEVIAAIARHPGCLPTLAAAAAPTLAGIVERGAAARHSGCSKRQRRTPAQARAHAADAAASASEVEDSPMLVEASLDLLAALATPGQTAVAAQLCGSVLSPVLSLIQASDDASELQSAVALLQRLMRVCPPEQFLQQQGGSSGGAEGATVTQLVAAARHLLSGVPDGATRLAGPYIAQLLKTFPAQLAAPPSAVLLGSNAAPAHAASSCVALLLHDTVCKMGSGSCSPATVSFLLQFVVRLALLDVQQLVELLASIALQKRDGSSTTGLAVVVPLLLEHASDMPGGLATRQCAAALINLLQLRHHPALSGLMVAGRPLEVAGGGGRGRVTRARSQQQGGLRFTQVPAPAKVLQVLGQLLSSDAESRGSEPAWARALAAQWAGGEESSDEEEEGGGEGADSPAAQGMTAATLHAAGMGVLEADVLSDIMERSAAATPVLFDDDDEAGDPLQAVSMRALVQQGLGALAAADGAFMQAAAAQLGPGRELQALQELLAGGDDAPASGGGAPAQG